MESGQDFVDELRFTKAIDSAFFPNFPYFIQGLANIL
jgi:hypothetical protein